MKHSTLTAAGLVQWHRQATDCGAPLAPNVRRTLEPTNLWAVLDRHLQPPRSAAAAASIECGHLSLDLQQLNDDNVQWGRDELGYPDLDRIWAARDELAELGLDLVVHVEIELADDGIVLSIHGAGVTGEVGRHGWMSLASHLTTCTATVWQALGPLPARTTFARRVWQALPDLALRMPIPTTVPAPRHQFVGRSTHTWWEYSPGLKSGCGRDLGCTAHRLAPDRAATQHFGPQGRH